MPPTDSPVIEKEVPCAALQVLQVQVENNRKFLTEWITRQNGSLTRLSGAMDTILAEMRQAAIATSETRSQRKLDDIAAAQKIADALAAADAARKEAVSEQQARIDAIGNKILYWCLGTLGFVLTILMGFIIAHINKVI